MGRYFSPLAFLLNAGQSFWILIVVCAALMSVSCSTDNKRIALFDDYSYTLLPDESTQPINDKRKSTYFSILKDSTFQIPLYKCISGKGYETFIGIPYRMELSDFERIFLVNPEKCTVVTKTDGKTMFYRTYRNDENNISELVCLTENNLILVITVAENANILDERFDLDHMTQRMTNEKK